jgi:hypothetical protein
MNDNEINIGFSCFGNLLQVGNVFFFLSFFGEVKKIIKTGEIPQKYIHLICDRLYKRYIKEEDLAATTEAMDFIAEKFKSVTKTFEENEHMFSCYKRILKKDKFFRIDEGEKYFPIRIVVAELPHCVIDNHRLLSTYDTHDGPPFWTRFYLKEFYDQGKPMPELPF